MLGWVLSQAITSNQYISCIIYWTKFVFYSVPMPTSKTQKRERNLNLYQNNGSHEGFADWTKIFGQTT